MLAVVVVLIGGLVLLGRVGSSNPPESGGVAVVIPDSPVVAAESPTQPPRAVRRRPSIVAQPPAPTPTLDLMVRAEGHRRILRAGRGVYLDSLLAEGDSVLRRWPDTPGAPITFTVVRDTVFAQAGAGEAVVREAFRLWEAVLPRTVRFAATADTAAADILIRWQDQFPTESARTGQTDLVLASSGAILGGTITLALRDPAGRRLDRAAALLTAIHEVGHAIGLAHSADPRDVMHPTPRAPTLSDRDRRTVDLIYGLPPGSVKGG